MAMNIGRLEDQLVQMSAVDAPGREFCEAIAELAGKISDREMQQLNYALDGQHRDVKDVAQEFLRSKGLIH